MQPVIRQELHTRLRIIVQEIPRHLVLFGLFEFDFRNARFVEPEDFGIGIRQQDRRMRRDDELRLIRNQLADRHERGQLARWGQGGFRFIKKVEALSPQLVGQ